ncbi:hypothetical protein LguiB_032100 [Lonicera macranthoides]
MSSGDGRKVSRQEIQLVQNLIEQCLQLYMSQKEVMTALFVQEKIEPRFTELVWQKLEEENPEFFKAYHLRLLVKDQIREFNSLLARHVELKHQVGQSGGCFVSMSNGSHIPPMHQNSTCYAQENSGPALKTENMHQQAITTTLPNGLTNCGSSMNSCMQTGVDASAHSTRIDVSQNMGMIRGGGINGGGGIIKTETSYTGGDPRYIFGGGDGNVRSAISDAAAGSSFRSVEPTSTLLDADSSSFGYFGQDFGLSDLTAEFSNGFDIVESYSGSSFLPTGSDNFLDSHIRGDHSGGEYKGLNGQSEGLSYEDFGSD